MTVVRNWLGRNMSVKDVIYEKLPSLFLAAFDAYGKKSYSVMDDSTVPVEQGGSQ